MKDSAARGIVLKQLYDIRHQLDRANGSDFAGLPIEPKILPNILDQLAQQNLIDWNPLRGGMGSYLAFMAKITAFGVDVVEGNVASPITVTIDSSVNVHGSQNVQVGGQGNVQTVTMEFEKMINAVEGADVSVSEKAEAKSLLQKIAGDKLVQSVISKYVLGK
jgi:hypothetical protein